MNKPVSPLDLFPFLKIYYGAVALLFGMGGSLIAAILLMKIIEPVEAVLNVSLWNALGFKFVIGLIGVFGLMFASNIYSAIERRFDRCTNRRETWK